MIYVKKRSYFSLRTFTNQALCARLAARQVLYGFVFNSTVSSE